MLASLVQVVKNAKQTQARKANKAGGYADDDTKPAEEPKRWSDYTVSHLQLYPNPVLDSKTKQQPCHASLKDCMRCVGAPGCPSHGACSRTSEHHVEVVGLPTHTHVASVACMTMTCKMQPWK